MYRKVQVSPVKAVKIAGRVYSDPVQAARMYASESTENWSRSIEDSCYSRGRFNRELYTELCSIRRKKLYKRVKPIFARLLA